MTDVDRSRRGFRKGRLVLFAIGAVMAGVVFVAAHPAGETAREVKAQTNLSGETAKAPGRVAVLEDMPGGPASRQLNASLASFPGRRDPFRLPPPPAPHPRHDIAGDKKRASAVNLPPGPRGLVIAQLQLKGVVSENATHQMIAVVTNSTNRAYFLHENEELYDGVVSRITPSAIYFRERARNAYGVETEVVKTLIPSSGELK